MSSLLALAKDLEQQSKVQQQSKDAFSEHEKSVKVELSASAKRISDAISAHKQGMTAAMQSNRLSVLCMVGRMWLTITLVSVLLIATSGSILWLTRVNCAETTITLCADNNCYCKLKMSPWECGRIPGPSGVNLCIHTRTGSGPSNSITGTERKPPLSSWSWDILPQNSWAVGFGFMKRRAIYPGN